MCKIKLHACTFDYFQLFYKLFFVFLVFFLLLSLDRMQFWVPKRNTFRIELLFSVYFPRCRTIFINAELGSNNFERGRTRSATGSCQYRSFNEMKAFLGWFSSTRLILPSNHTRLVYTYNTRIFVDRWPFETPHGLSMFSFLNLSKRDVVWR